MRSPQKVEELELLDDEPPIGTADATVMKTGRMLVNRAIGTRTAERERLWERDCREDKIGRGGTP
jgi:hypothetical protein